MIIARPGGDRPLSMKLTCRCVVPAPTARSSWLTRRRSRPARGGQGSPLALGSPTSPPVYPGRRPPRDSRRGIAGHLRPAASSLPYLTAHHPRGRHTVMTRNDTGVDELADRYVAV